MFVDFSDFFLLVIEAEDAEKAKHDLGEFAQDASAMAEHAKETGASLLDHAKGAAAAALAAGSKAAEEIADEKLKDAENVIFLNAFLIHF